MKKLPKKKGVKKNINKGHKNTGQQGISVFPTRIVIDKLAVYKQMIPRFGYSLIFLSKIACLTYSTSPSKRKRNKQESKGKEETR